MPFLLKTLAAAVAFIGVSYGATCEGGSALACVIADGALARTADLWAARQDYCGNNRWQSTSCFRYQTKTVPVFIQNSKPGTNSQQTCWDALENIINRNFTFTSFYHYQ